MNEELTKKQCDCCLREDSTTKERTIKEDGVVGYYDRTVLWCDRCVEGHNKYLLENWG